MPERDFDPPDPDDPVVDGSEFAEWMSPPDVVDLVLESATMESVFAAQRLIRIDAMRRELLVEAEGRGTGVRDIVERSIRLELAAAMRITEYAAERMIRQADALVHRYPGALDSLAGGRTTTKHAEILVDQVDQLMPELREQVTARAVELAETEPVGTFRRALRALIETVQAPTLQERYDQAVKTRRVVVEPGFDAMGTLMLFAPLVELHAIFARTTAIAKPSPRSSRTRKTTRLEPWIRSAPTCSAISSSTGSPTRHRPKPAVSVLLSWSPSRCSPSSTTRRRQPQTHRRSRVSARSHCRRHGNCAAAKRRGCGC